jgi:hypothetical protein
MPNHEQVEGNSMMKALSFRQPWAELVLQGRKTMDLRTYRTEHRGPLAIHASKTVEREACLRHGLDPDSLNTGGIVGVVELADVLSLTEADYEAHLAEHLAGRPFREPMYGWVLSEPQRLPQMIPARGRMSLFNVNLEDPKGFPTDLGSAPLGSGEDAPTPMGQERASRQPVVYTAGTLAGDPERPFALHVRSSAGSSTSYALTLKQRIVERDRDQSATGSHLPAGMTTIVTLDGDNLRAVADHVIEALRQADYRATDLSPERREPFFLPEAVGVRLGLVFLAVKPLSKLRRLEEISQGIRQMPLEEAYYWYSKCTATGTAERAQKALRVLLAAD